MFGINTYYILLMRIPINIFTHKPLNLHFQKILISKENFYNLSNTWAWGPGYGPLSPRH